MFRKKIAAVTSQISPLGDSINVPQGRGLFSSLRGVLAQLTWHRQGIHWLIPGPSSQLQGSSAGPGTPGFHTTGERKAGGGMDVSGTGRKGGFLRRDRQSPGRKHRQGRHRVVLSPCPWLPFPHLSVFIASSGLLWQWEALPRGKQKRNTSTQMHLASEDTAPAPQDAPQLVMLLCLPSGPHRSNAPQFIQTPRVQREEGEKKE